MAVWFIQSRVDALRQAESRLRDERRKIYADLLEPYIKALSSSDDSRKGQKQFTAYELKKAAFELSLIGSDQVIRAFNAMMQALYRAEREGKNLEAYELLSLWGDLLLQIRKNVGDPGTKLSSIDVLKGTIKDIEIITGAKGDDARS